MTELSLLNGKFETAGKFKTDVSLSAENINVPVVHQIVKSILAGRRQGTASTKNRTQVRGGGAKPFKQKGTGRARQGSARSFVQVGGATCFGPTPRSYKQKMNKKMMLNAIHSVIADKHQAGKLIVVEKLVLSGKTKEANKLFTDRGILSALVVCEDGGSKALLAVRNLKRFKGIAVEGFSVYEVLKYENLVIEKSALSKLLSKLS